MIFDWLISTPISLTQQDSWHRDQFKGHSPEQIGWQRQLIKSKNILLGVMSVHIFNQSFIKWVHRSCCPIGQSIFNCLDKDEWKVTQLLDKMHKQHVFRFVFSSIQNKLQDKLRLSDMSLTVVHAIHFRLSTISQLLSTGHLHKLLWCFRYWLFCPSTKGIYSSFFFKVKSIASFLLLVCIPV